MNHLSPTYISVTLHWYLLRQWSPISLTPGTYVMEDNFSTIRVGRDDFRMIRAHYIQVHPCCAVMGVGGQEAAVLPNRPGE